MTKLSKYAHPITHKVWMTIKHEPIGYYSMSGTGVGGSAEIFEDGLVIYFDERGTRTYSKQFVDQRHAVNHLLKEGWKINSSEEQNIPRYMRL